MVAPSINLVQPWKFGSSFTAKRFRLQSSSETTSHNLVLLPLHLLQLSQLLEPWPQAPPKGMALQIENATAVGPLLLQLRYAKAASASPLACS